MLLVMSCVCRVLFVRVEYCVFGSLIETIFDTNQCGDDERLACNSEVIMESRVKLSVTLTACRQSTHPSLCKGDMRGKNKTIHR